MSSVALIADGANLIMCMYGSSGVKVPKDVLCRSCLLRDTNEDCQQEDGSFYANIPIINDANGNPIHLNEAELALFFELAALESLTVEHLKKCAITPDLLKRFLILVNFLDYEVYLLALCNYAAVLIKEGIFTLN